MLVAAIELDEFRRALPSMIAANEQALAGCSGHRFEALNSRVLGAGCRCTKCGGVVDGATVAVRAGRAPA